MLTVDANVWVAAFDARDRFHDGSVAFLLAVARMGLQLHGPAFVALEVGCALARRSGDPSVGVAGYERLRAHPALSLHPVDLHCLEAARELGTRNLLRGADALYAATAELLGVPLITWDQEMMARSMGISPDAWLAKR